MNLWRLEKQQARIALHPGQGKAWQSARRFVFIIAGTQGGKTSFGPWWLWREIKAHGAGDYLAVTASYDLFKLKMLPEIRTVFERLLNIGRWWSGDKVLELRDPETGRFWAKRADDPMWGRIILRSAQSGGGLESATAKAAWLDECGQDSFTLEDWDAIQARLSLYEGRALGTTTPYNLGWVKSQVYDAWAEGDPDFDVISFPSVMNPAFPRREYERRERQMQEWRFGMRYKGIFTRPAGLIYACFDDAMLVDAFPIPLDWDRVVGVDFGGANTATLWLAEDPATSIWYAYHESLEGDQTSREHAEKAREFVEGCEDVAAVGGGPSEDQDRRDWADGGFTVDRPTISEVEAGIDRGTELIKGKRLRVFRSVRGFRDEIGSYRRKVLDDGTVLEDIVDKRRFHRLDAFRYAAIRIIEGGGMYLW